MARISEGVFKNWVDGEKMKAADYMQERELMRVAINDNHERLVEISRILNALEGGVVIPPLDTIPPVITVNPNAGTYTSVQNVVLSANEEATIYYTLDGSTPTILSAVYSNPIPISTTTTLKYFAKDVSGNSSGVQTAVYNINITASAIRSLSITAHQDESIVGFTPDLLYDIRNEENEVVIEMYLTAGDAGNGWGTYAQNREKGARAAYASMAGVADNWTMDTDTYAGKTVATATLNGTNIKHIYLRLPDGNFSGGGFAGTGNIGIYDVWQGTKTTITSMDRTTTFTKDELISFIKNVIDTYSINTFRHFIHTNTLGDGEHYDHWVAGRLANAAVQLSNILPNNVVAYRVGSSLIEGNELKTPTELEATQTALSAYALYDSANPFNSSPTNWKNDSTLVNKTEVVWRMPYTPTHSNNTPPSISSSYATADVLDTTSVSIPYTVTNVSGGSLTATYSKNGVPNTTNISVGSNTWNVGALSVGTHTLTIQVKNDAGISSNLLSFTIKVAKYDGIILSHTFTAPNSTTGVPKADTGQNTLALKGTFGVTNNRAYGVTDDYPIIAWETGKSDVEVSVDNVLSSNLRQGGLLFRVVDATNWLGLRWFTDDTIQLSVCVNGTEENPWKTTYPMSAGTYKLKVIANGPLIKCFINNVQVGTDVTDTTYMNATKHGLRGFTSWQSNATDQFDNFIVRDIL